MPAPDVRANESVPIVPQSEQLSKWFIKHTILEMVHLMSRFPPLSLGQETFGE